MVLAAAAGLAGGAAAGGMIAGGAARLVESRIFFPDRHLEAGPADYGLAAEEVWLEAPGSPRLHGWFCPAGGGNLLLFCHGNAGNISHRLDNVLRLVRAGLGVFIFDYRGYGRSEGRPSEEGIYADALTAYDWAQARAAADGGRLVVFGRSLGGAAAVHLAARRRPAGVILESTFTNLADMARRHFPLPLPASLLAGRFDSLGRIGEMSCPLLVIHGDRDEIVPLELGRRLYEAAPRPKEWLALAGAGHNDTYLVGGPAYFERLARFAAGR